MARHFLQSTHPLVSVVRNNIEVFATLAAIAAGAVVPLPSPSARDRSVRTVEARTADGTPRVGATSTRPTVLAKR